MHVPLNVMMNLLVVLPLLLALVGAEETHNPSVAATTAPTASTGFPQPNQPPPNLVLPPPSVPRILNNRSITVTNSCPTDLWPAVLTTNHTGPYVNGFYLPAKMSLQLWVSHDWTGRIWARTNCSFNESTNTGPCFTGSCGNVMNCTLSGEPPTTLAEFNLLGWQNLSFWDISLVNGFNLPMAIYPSPSGPKPICQWATDPESMKDHCPQELVFYADEPKSYLQVAGCMSACDQYGDAKYCCTGNKNSPDSCSPSRYSKPFKEMCPDAYTYAYDDKTSTFATATGPDWSYEVVFCPGKAIYVLCLFQSVNRRIIYMEMRED
jgi:hypothetical protein